MEEKPHQQGKLQRVKTMLGTSRSRMQQPIQVAQGQGQVRVCVHVQEGDGGGCKESKQQQTH